MDEVFGLTKPLWEIAIRATVVYFILVLLIRFVPKRRAGTISPNDMLALIVIGGLATDAIVGGSQSVADILLMVGLVVGWGYLLDLLQYRSTFIRRLMRDRHTLLVRDGRLLRKNLAKEMITEEELLAVMREKGAGDLSLVREAHVEADGEISVITNENR